MRQAPSSSPQLSFARRQRAAAQRPAPLALPEPAPVLPDRDASLHDDVIELGESAYEAAKLSLLILAACTLASLLAFTDPRTAIQVLLCGAAMAVALFAIAWLGLALCTRVRWRGE